MVRASLPVNLAVDYKRCGLDLDKCVIPGEEKHLAVDHTPNSRFTHLTNRQRQRLSREMRLGLKCGAA